MRKVSDESRRFNFTAKRLEDWPVDGREVCLFDTGKPGLVLRIRRESKVFYHWRTDGKSGRTVKCRIGSMADTSLADARAEVDKRNGATAKADGVVPKRERHGPVTLGEAFDTYIAEHVATGGRCEVQYRRWYRLYLERHAAMPMDSINAPWINENIKVGIVNIRNLDEKRTKARRAGGRAVANAVVALVSTMFTHYLRDHDPEGKRANPCDRVELYPKRARRQAMNEDETRRFIEAIDTYKREHAVYAVTRRRLGWVKGQPIPKKVDLADLLFMALITGRRRGSIARMKFADLSLGSEHPTWTIPPEDNKAGVEDVVTLHPVVAQLLRERRKAAPKDAVYVLPGAVGGERGSKSNKVADPRTVFRIILGIAGITNARLVPHSLRATFITNGLRMKHSTESVRNAVGHASIASTAGYAALLEDDKRRVADAIGDGMLKGRDAQREDVA